MKIDAKAFDVFISHSTKDEHAASAIKQRLQERGLKCWKAPDDIKAGESWPAAITRALENCQAMVLVWTANSLNSPEVAKELTLAMRNGVTVLPFRLENIEATAEWRYHLANMHWMDAFPGSYLNHIDKLAERLAPYGSLARPSTERPVAIPAPSSAPKKVDASTISSSAMPKLMLAAITLASLAAFAVLILYEILSGPAKGRQPDATTLAHSNPASEPMKPSPDSPVKQQASPSSESYVLDFAEALHRADAGDAYAQAVVSTYYDLGYKTAADSDKAVEYAVKSADQRHPLGLYRLGDMRGEGRNMPKDEGQGTQLKKEAFAGLDEMFNDPYALNALGVMLFGGEGGAARNLVEAARLYKLAADQGYAPAQLNLSACYLTGRGVPRDEALGMKYWQDAYNQNYPPALRGPPR